jgi:hypothetical protein
MLRNLVATRILEMNLKMIDEGLKGIGKLREFPKGSNHEVTNFEFLKGTNFQFDAGAIGNLMLRNLIARRIPEGIKSRSDKF